MMRPTRPSADQTRQNILGAAKEQFLKYGFDATYIKNIAQAAKVNTNLIFHHFKNKETLWLKVKESILNEPNDLPEYDLSSAKSYFNSIIDYRFKLFGDNPNLVRLLQWQQLTDSESLLVGSDPSSPLLWLDQIRTFQKMGQVKSTIEAEQIMLFIIFSTHAAFMQKVIVLTPKQILHYKKMIMSMIDQQFVS